MTNEERKEMYQDWENFVFEIFCQMKKNDGHDSRCALLIVYTETEYVELHKAGEAYWTEWED